MSAALSRVDLVLCVSDGGVPLGDDEPGKQCPRAQTSNLPEISGFLHPSVTIELLDLRLEYDPETGELTWLPWGPHAGGQPAGIASSTGELTIYLAGQAIEAGRVAWAMTHAVIPDRVEHINGDLSDNRLPNLREA